MQHDISGSPVYEIKFVGQPKLKGVKQDIRVYCLTSHGLTPTKLSDVSAKLESQPGWWIRYASSGTIAILVVVYIVIARGNELPSVGVLHIQNLNNSAEEYWTRGVTEDLIIELASTGLVRIPPLADILRFGTIDFSTQDIANQLGVEHLLVTSMLLEDRIVNFRAQLVNPAIGSVVYANKWNQPVDSLAPISKQLTSGILNSLGVKDRSIHLTSIPHPEAYELYLKGKYIYDNRQNLGDLEQSQSLFRESLEIDKNLIDAQIYLGKSFFDRGNYTEALNIFQDCYTRSVELGNSRYIAESLVNISSIFNKWSKHIDGLEYSKQALEQIKEVNDLHTEISVHNALGESYISILKDWKYTELKKAKRHFKVAHRIAQKNGFMSEEATALLKLAEIEKAKAHNWGMVFQNKVMSQGISRNRLDIEYIELFEDYHNSKWRTLLENSIEINKSIKSKARLARAYYAMTELSHDEKGANTDAGSYCEKALRLAEEIGDKAFQVDCYNKLWIYIENFEALDVESENFLIQEQLLKTAYAIAQDIDYGEGVFWSADYLALIYSMGGMLNLALEYQKIALNKAIYMDIKDFVKAEETSLQGLEVWMKNLRAEGFDLDLPYGNQLMERKRQEQENSSNDSLNN